MTAIDYGAEIYPYPPPINESAKAFAETIGANIVWGRAESIKYGGHSLSPMSATANKANLLRAELGTNITVVSCGEKWPDALKNEDKLRPSIEDYLGAGIILSKLTGSKSPEAEVCIGAYEYSKNKISELIWDSASGRELRERGYEQDVIHCSQVDITTVVPILHENKFIRL
ncbi:2-phosphosulfolactate phosphatase [Paenibacillus sp. GCM10012307]|uniref:2-phosphosulfolactate phosphatase n=1 Tax=Paenibacillus sp. GCM10012307 TaxID=3317343 RepID=UPI003610E81E